MIKLAQPQIPEQAIEDAVAVLRSGNLVQGKYVEAFERALQAYLGVRHVIVVSSGTAALHLSLMALGIGPGDEVIVPAFTFPATANVVELCGARPVFVDISLDDYCMDVSRLKGALTAKTKAMIPVHEFGQSVDMDGICRFAEENKLLLIEDAACALGTMFRGKKAGTFGKTGCLSFHPRKTITTGEGGAAVTDDDEAAARIRAMRNHGIAIHNGKTDFIYAGLNYRMTDFQAALGSAQLSDIENLIAARVGVAERYNRRLAESSRIRTPFAYADRKHVYQTYHVLLDDHIDRDGVIASLRKDGIETNIGAQAMNCLAYYREKYCLDESDYPNASKAFRQGLALPNGSHISDKDVDFITDRLTRWLI